MSGAPLSLGRERGDPDSPWSNARVLLLVDHYRRGLSASESATLIGGVSKNAVISKRRRLGLFAVVAAPRSPDGGESRPRERVRPFRILRGPASLPVTPLP
jgi:GcrA cell cycle regulator